ADHHPAALAVRERSVVAVLDDVEDVEQGCPVGRLDVVALQLSLAGLAVEAPDLERHLDRRRAGCGCKLGVGHQYLRSCGCHFVMVTGFHSRFERPSSSSVTSVCCMKFSSSRFG